MPIICVEDVPQPPPLRSFLSQDSTRRLSFTQLRSRSLEQLRSRFSSSSRTGLGTEDRKNLGSVPENEILRVCQTTYLNGGVLYEPHRIDHGGKLFRDHELGEVHELSNSQSSETRLSPKVNLISRPPLPDLYRESDMLNYHIPTRIDYDAPTVPLKSSKRLAGAKYRNDGRIEKRNRLRVDKIVPEAIQPVRPTGTTRSTFPVNQLSRAAVPSKKPLLQAIARHTDTTATEVERGRSTRRKHDVHGTEKASFMKTSTIGVKYRPTSAKLKTKTEEGELAKQTRPKNSFFQSSGIGRNWGSRRSGRHSPAVRLRTGPAGSKHQNDSLGKSNTFFSKSHLAAKLRAVSPSAVSWLGAVSRPPSRHYMPRYSRTARARSLPRDEIRSSCSSSEQLTFAQALSDLIIADEFSKKSETPKADRRGRRIAGKVKSSRHNYPRSLERAERFRPPVFVEPQLEKTAKPLKLPRLTEMRQTVEPRPKRPAQLPRPTKQTLTIDAQLEKPTKAPRLSKKKLTAEETDFEEGRLQLFYLLNIAREKKDDIIRQKARKRAQEAGKILPPNWSQPPLEKIKLDRDLEEDAKLSAGKQDLLAAIVKPRPRAAVSNTRNPVTHIETIERTDQVLLIGPPGWGAMALGIDWGAGANVLHARGDESSEREEDCRCRTHRIWDTITDPGFRYVGIARTRRQRQWVVHLAHEKPSKPATLACATMKPLPDLPEEQQPSDEGDEEYFKDDDDLESERAVTSTAGLQRCALIEPETTPAVPSHQKVVIHRKPVPSLDRRSSFTSQLDTLLRSLQQQ